MGACAMCNGPSHTLRNDSEPLPVAPSLTSMGGAFAELNVRWQLHCEPVQPWAAVYQQGAQDCQLRTYFSYVAVMRAGAGMTSGKDSSRS